MTGTEMNVIINLQQHLHKPAQKRFSLTSKTVPCGHTQPDRGSLQLDCMTLEPCCWPGGSRLEQVRRQERGE